MPINLANKNKRDAQVSLETVHTLRAVSYIDPDGKLTHNVRLLKSTVDQQALTETYGLDELADALIKGDPEIDVETFGRYLTETSRVYIHNNKICFHVREEEVVKTPDGLEKERRDREVKLQNVNIDIPIQWSNKFIKKKDAIRKFVFTDTKQIFHTNGLTWDFLFDMAKELADKDSLMLIGGGRKGNEPLTFQRGGRAYRGFLEGRVDAESYCLLLHLSNLELKLPE